MSDEYGVVPTILDLTLPQTPEACFGFRVAIGEAMQHLMALKEGADQQIAEYMGDRTEAVVLGETYSYTPSTQKWEYDTVALLRELTALQAAGDLTQADYDSTIEIHPQPDVVKVNTTKIKALVAKRGLTQLDECRRHVVGPKRLRRVG